MFVNQLWTLLKSKRLVTIHPCATDLIKQYRLQISVYCTQCVNCGHIELNLYYFHKPCPEREEVIRCGTHRSVDLRAYTDASSLLQCILPETDPYFCYFKDELSHMIASVEEVEMYNKNKHIRFCASPEYCYCDQNDCLHFRPCVLHEKL